MGCRHGFTQRISTWVNLRQVQPQPTQRHVRENPPPPTQALNITTFIPPPLDLSLTTAETIDFHRAHNPMSYMSTKTLLESESTSLSLHESVGVKPIVSILANSDTITYAITELGIVRAEGTAFPISPDAAIAILKEQGFEIPIVQLLPAFENLFPDDDSEDFEYLPEPKLKGLDDPVIILHSSGSVAFPKPITFTNRVLIGCSRLLWYGGRDMCDTVISGHAAPVFHGIGLNLLVFTIGTGTTTAVFRPAFPPTLPTPDLVYAGSVATKSDIIFCPPMFVEVWAKDPGKLEHFKTIYGLFYAGAPLKKSVGDHLVSQGVAVFQLNGSIEIGTVIEALPKKMNKEWEWFRLSPSAKPLFPTDTEPMSWWLRYDVILTLYCATIVGWVVEEVLTGTQRATFSSRILRSLVIGKYSVGLSRQLDNTMKGMKDLVDKYAKDFPAHKPAGGVPLQEDTILVTGTTGAIGSATLAELYKSPNVARVVVLARKSTTPISVRQRRALVDRGLNPSIVDSPKTILLEGDADLPGFGLDDGVLLELRSIVTCILHIEWTSTWVFRRSNVAGVRNLINFALESKLPAPPRFIFASTVAVVALTKSPGLIPEKPAAPESATLNGYSQSKWVLERTPEAAAEKTSLRPVIVRIGQVSGGVNGCWNPPGVDPWNGAACCSYQVTAQALVQVLDAKTTPLATHLHLVNPTPFRWDVMFDYIAKKLDVPLVPYVEWFSKLKEASTTVKNAQDYSALCLLGFYESLAQDGESVASGLRTCSTEVTRGACPVLNGEDLREAKDEGIQRWLDYWKSLGLMRF